MTSHFRQLIDALPQAVLVHRNGRPLFANARFTGLTGCPPDDLNAVKSLVAADPWQRWLTNAGEQAAVSVTDRRGQALALRARRTEVPWKGGPAWMETLDVRAGGEGIEAEGNLEYRALSDGLPQGVLVHQAGQVLYANPALVRMLGFASSREAYRGNSVLKRFDAADVARIAESAAPRGDGAEGTPLDVHVSWPGATPLWLRASSSRIDWQGAAAIATLVEDVTEQRRAAQALLAEARNQRHAEEVARIGHWEWHLSSQAITWSDGAYRIYGRTREEFQPTVKNALSAVHPDDREAVADALNVALREGKSFTQEFRALSPDGTVRLCVDQVTVELDAAGNPARLLGVLMDVGDARRTERQLKESRRLLETVLESIPYSVFVKDADSRFILANSAEAKSFHMAPEELRGLRSQDVPGIDPATLALALQEDRTILETGLPIVQEERRSRVAAEPGIWRRAIKVPLRDEQGRVVGIVGLSEDITQRVEAEQQLKAHRQLLHTVMETIPHGIFVKDAAGSYLLSNTRYASAFGLTPDALQGLRTEQLPGFSPEVIASTEADDEAILSSAKPHIEREFPSPAPNSQGELHRLIKVPMRDEQGKVTAVVGIVENVTHRREAERRLQESEQLLKSVLESLPHALFVKDTGGRYVLVNGLFASRFGLTPEQVHGRRPEEMPGVSGDFLKMTLEDDVRVLEAGETIVRDDVQAPSPFQQGQWRRLIKRRLLNRQGEVTGVIGTTEDITQRKEAERQVLEVQRRLQTIIDTLPQAIFLKDTQGRYLLVNDAYGRIRGITREQTVGRLTDEVSRGTTAQVDQWIAMDQEVLRTGRPVIDAEYPYLYPDGHTGIRMLTKLPFFDTNGNLAGVLGVSEDITERKQGQEQLRASQRLFQAVFDTLPLSVFVKDREGRYTAVNRAMAELWQVRPEAIVGKRVIVEANRPEEEIAVAVNTDTIVLTQGQTVEITPQQTLPDGRTRIMRVKKTPLRDEQGAVIGLVGTAEDITERQQAEQRLQDSERLLQTVIDTIPQSIFLKDLQGRFLLVNDAYARSHAMTKEEALRMTVPQLPGGTPDQKDQWAALDAQVLETGLPSAVEIIPFTLPNGALRVRTLAKLPVHDANGALVGILGISEDITERQQAEQRLRQSQHLLQTIIDTLPQAIFLKDGTGRHLVTNDAFAKIRGLPKAEIIGARNEQLGHPSQDEVAVWNADDRAVIGEGRVIGPVEYPFTMPDGSVTTRILYKLPLLDESGVVVGVLGVSEDVTERRKAETRLKESERLLQTVFDTIPLDMWVKNRDRRFLRVNQAMARRWTTTPEALVGQMAPSSPDAPEGELGRIAATDLQVLEEGHVVDVHIPRTEPDGRRRIQHHIKAPLRNESGEVVGIVGISEDVTEVRRAEQDLRASREQLRQVLEATSEGWWECDVPAARVQYSPGWQRLFGYGADQTPKTLDDWKALIHPDDVRRVLNTVSTSLATEEGRFESEYRVRAKSGEWVWVLDRGKVVVRDAKGNPLRQVGAFFDIRGRKKAEDDLRASQRLLQTVFETIPHPVFVKDREGRYIAANRAMSELWKTSAEAIIGQKVILQAARPGTESQTTQASDQEVMSSGRPSAFIRNQTLPDGTVHRLAMKKTPLLGDAGQVIGLVGVLEDITEQERAQEDLRANQRLLNAIINALPLGLTAKDAQGRFILMNPTVLSVYKCKAGDMLGRTSLELPWYLPADARHSYDQDMQVLTSGVPLDVQEESHRLPDNTVITRRVIKTPILDEHGKVSGLVVVTEDISPRKRAEQSLRESQRLLKTMFDNLTYGLTLKDREGRYVLVNEAMLKRYGAKMEQFIGRKSTEIPVFPREMSEELEQEDRHVVETGEFQVMPLREIKYPNGKVSIRRFIKIPIKDEQGQVTGVMTASEDLTQQVRAEQELLRSKALLQTIFDTIPMDILVKDTDSRIVAMNRRMLEHFQIPESEMLGKQTPEPVSPEGLRHILASDRRVLDTGEAFEEVQHRTMADGSLRHYRVLKSPLRDGAGKISGIVGLAEDITERLAAEQELLRSKALLQTVFDTIPHDVWVKDQEARYVSANRQMLQTFGRTIEAIAGKPTALPATPNELAVIVESDMEVIRSGKVADMVQTRTFPDGSVHQFRVIKTPLRDETGQVNGLVGIAEDVTERLRSERELRENRLLLQTVFDALPLWVFVKDRERRLLMVNRQMVADYGMDPVGIVSGGENDPADPETQAASRRYDMEVLETGKRVETAEFPFKVRGQPARILRSVRVPLTDSQGRMIGIVGISEDITERKRAEQALLQTQKLESLGILAGGIAHDFNNLLTGILGNVELALLELDATHHARGPLNNVKNASLMAAGLTRQMLAYSGGGRFELRPILLNSMVEDMAQLLRVTVPRNVNVVYKFEPNLPLVEADTSQLQQVIMNLITNASEAIGDRPGDVVLTTGMTHVTRAELEAYHLAGDVSEGDYVLLQVADTGSGMPPATLQRIFDPFFTTKFTGRGLGLAAVLGIVRSHRGAIRVTSEVGKGTTFRILLPAAGQASPRSAPALTNWTGGGTVLVVDDEAHVRQVAAAMLRELGMTVLEATGGEEAVRQVREHRSEIGWVLLDASMPGLSGPDALRAMRDVAPELVVVMMSGFSERELQERFRGMNIRGFLQKPFTFEDLSNKLSTWLDTGSVGTPKLS